MFARHNLAILELLRSHQAASPERLREAGDESTRSGRPLAEVVIALGLVEKHVLLRLLADDLGCEHAIEVPAGIPDGVISALPGNLARGYGVVPLRIGPQSVDLLALDPFNRQIVEDLTFALGKEVRLVVGDPEKIGPLLSFYYGDEDAALDGLLKEITGPGMPGEARDLSATDLEALAGQAPVIRFVNLVLSQAIRERASDIHFEPFEHEFKIRYRLDGTLYELPPPPQRLALPVTSRLKVIAHLDIAERRLPQDGRIRLTLGGRPVDLRVSTLPTQFGESVVLRVLDPSATSLDLGALGLPDEVQRSIGELIRRPNGIFIVTGPTGAGKTTTLYSCLRAVNTPDLKLLTIEDPVEYEIEGIMQVPVNPAAGLTFASALRSFLRQDPDIIMVGEIRDAATARIAFQAALTGHLVFSTLHTNDAAGAVTRLIDLGVEPFLVASSLEAVLAQRLVRRICPQCRTPCRPPAALLEQLGPGTPDPASRRFFRGRGCSACHQTGYRGRLGLFELLRFTDPLRDLTARHAPAPLIQRQACEQGMRTLREAGLRAVFDGITTVEEVVGSTG